MSEQKKKPKTKEIKLPKDIENMVKEVDPVAKDKHILRAAMRRRGFDLSRAELIELSKHEQIHLCVLEDGTEIYTLTPGIPLDGNVTVFMNAAMFGDYYGYVDSIAVRDHHILLTCVLSKDPPPEEEGVSKDYPQPEEDEINNRKEGFKW